MKATKERPPVLMTRYRSALPLVNFLLDLIRVHTSISLEFACIEHAARAKRNQTRVVHML